MGKNKFYKPENQFPQAGIVTPKFQKLQKSYKKILFSLDRNSVFASLNKEFVKKNIDTLRKNCFYSQDYLAKWKRLFFSSQKNSFYQE